MTLPTDSPAAAAPDAAAVPGALHGLRVVEMGQLIAGPFAGKTLGDFGAEVIKIEPPGAGDPLRNWRMLQDGTSVWWQVQSRNKRSIALDLRSAEGQDIARRLIGEADVLIENFRPGTLEGWGLGPDALLALNPGLVMLRISGYGQTGPYRDLPGFGAIGEAMGGLRHLTGEPGRVPVRCGISIGDTLAALHGTIGILAALYHRKVNGGRGQVIDVALNEAVFNVMESLIPEYSAFGAVREAAGSALPGFGAIGEAMGGLRHLTGEPGRVPVRCGISIGDTLAALHGTIGILAALYHRKVNGGRGQVIDVALNEAVFNVMESLIPEYSAFGAVREAAGSALPGIAPSNAYRCSDGFVLIAGNGDSIFRRLMQSIGRDDLAADPALADNAGRVARVAELDAAIEAWTLQRPVAEVLDMLGRAKVPAGKVYTAKDIAEDPHYRARDMLLKQRTRDGHELEVPGVVPKLLGTPGRVRSAAPRLGDDTDAVLRELGLSNEDIAALRGRKVVA
jgi:crotonobetainyl-CoA:carnitine CoA-transferase CaiB-like acyl-CoA transferase